MNLYHLEYIAEIAKTGNISRAAEHLHISQPTLSIYLNKLERSLGLRLFERRKNELIPTEAGLKYVDACRRILGIRDELYRDLFAEREAVVRLGILRTSISIFNEAFQALKQEFPATVFLPQIFSSEQIYSELTEGRIDLGFVTSYHPDFHAVFPKASYTVVKSYELMLMISRENPVFPLLRFKDGCLDEESYCLLQGLPIFQGKNAMVQRQMKEFVFPALGIHPKYRGGLIDIEFMFQAMMMENSFSILPESRIQGGNIAQIPFSSHPRIHRLFIHPAGKRLTRPEQALINRVRQAYEEISYYYDVSLL